MSLVFAFGIVFLILFFSERLSIALELAKHNPVYEDIASKFFEVRQTCVQSKQLFKHSSLAFYLHRGCHDFPRRRP